MAEDNNMSVNELNEKRKSERTRRLNEARSNDGWFSIPKFNLRNMRDLIWDWIQNFWESLIKAGNRIEWDLLDSQKDRSWKIDLPAKIFWWITWTLFRSLWEWVAAVDDITYKVDLMHDKRYKTWRHEASTWVRNSELLGGMAGDAFDIWAALPMGRVTSLSWAKKYGKSIYNAIRSWKWIELWVKQWVVKRWINNIRNAWSQANREAVKKAFDQTAWLVTKPISQWIGRIRSWFWRVKSIIDETLSKTIGAKRLSVIKQWARNTYAGIAATHWTLMATPFGRTTVMQYMASIPDVIYNDLLYDGVGNLDHFDRRYRRKRLEEKWFNMSWIANIDSVRNFATENLKDWIQNLEQFNTEIQESWWIKPFENKAEAENFLQDVYRETEWQSNMNLFMDTMTESMMSAAMGIGKGERFGLHDDPNILTDEEVQNLDQEVNPNAEIIGDLEVQKTGDTIDISSLNFLMNDEVKRYSENMDTIVEDSINNFIDQAGPWWDSVVNRAVSWEAKAILHKYKMWELWKIVDNLVHLRWQDARIDAFIKKTEESLEATITYTARYRYYQDQEGMDHGQANRLAKMKVTWKDTYAEAHEAYEDKFHISYGDFKLSDSYSRRQSINSFWKLLYANEYASRFDYQISKMHSAVMTFDKWKNETLNIHDGRVIANITSEVPKIDWSYINSLKEGILTKWSATTSTIVQLLVWYRLLRNNARYMNRKWWLPRAAAPARAEWWEEMLEQLIVNQQTLEEWWYALSFWLGAVLWWQYAVFSNRLDMGLWTINPNLKKNSTTDWMNIAIGYDKDWFINEVINDYSIARRTELTQKTDLTTNEQQEISFLQNDPSQNQLREYYRHNVVDIENAIAWFVIEAETIKDKLDGQTINDWISETNYIQADINKTIAEIWLAKYMIDNWIGDPSNANQTIAEQSVLLERQQDYYNRNYNNPELSFEWYIKEIYWVESVTSLQNWSEIRADSLMDTNSVVNAMMGTSQRSISKESFIAHVYAHKESYWKAIGRLWTHTKKRTGNPVFLDGKGFEKVTQEYWYQYVAESKTTIKWRDVIIQKWKGMKWRKEFEVWVIKDVESNTYIIWERRNPTASGPFVLPEWVTIGASESSTVDGKRISYNNVQWDRSYYIDTNGNILVNQDLIKDQDGSVSEADATAFKAQVTKEQQKKKRQDKAEDLRSKVIESIGTSRGSVLFRQMISQKDIFRDHIIDVYNQAKAEGLRVANDIRNYIVEVMDVISNFSQEVKDSLFLRLEEVFRKFNDGKKSTQLFINDTISEAVWSMAWYEQHVQEAVLWASSWLMNQWILLDANIDTNILMATSIAQMVTNKLDTAIENTDAILAEILVDDGPDNITNQYYKRQQLQLIKKKVAALDKYTTRWQRNKLDSNHINKVYNSIIDGIDQIFDIDEATVDSVKESFRVLFDDMDLRLSEIEVMSLLAQDYPVILNALENASEWLSKRIEWNDIGDLLGVLQVADPLPFAKWYLSNPRMTLDMLYDTSIDDKMIVDAMRVELLYGYISWNTIALKNYFIIISNMNEIDLRSVVQNNIDEMIEAYTYNMFKRFEQKNIRQELWRNDSVIGELYESRRERALDVSKKNQRGSSPSPDVWRMRIVFTIGKTKEWKSTRARKQKWFDVISINDYPDNIWANEAVKRFVADIKNYKGNNLIVDYSFSNPSIRNKIIKISQNKWADMFAVFLDRPESQRVADALEAWVDQSWIDSEVTVTPDDIATYDIQILDQDLKWFDIGVLNLSDDISIDNTIEQDFSIEMWSIETEQWRKFSYPKNISINHNRVNAWTNIYNVQELAAWLLVKVNPLLLEDYFTIDDWLQAYIEQKDLTEIKEYDPAVIIQRAYDFGILQQNESTIGDILTQVNLAALMLPSYQSQNFQMYLLQERLSDLFSIPNDNSTIDSAINIIKKDINNNDIRENTIKWLWYLANNPEYSKSQELRDMVKVIRKWWIPLMWLLSSISDFVDANVDINKKQVFVFDESQFSTDALSLEQREIQINEWSWIILVQRNIQEDWKTVKKLVDIKTKTIYDALDTDTMDIHVFHNDIMISGIEHNSYSFKSSYIRFRNIWWSPHIVMPRNIQVADKNVWFIIDRIWDTFDLNVPLKDSRKKQQANMLKLVWEKWFEWTVIDLGKRLSNSVVDLVLNTYWSALEWDIHAMSLLVDWINESREALWLQRYDSEQSSAIVEAIENWEISESMIRWIFIAENMNDVDAAHEFVYKKVFKKDSLLDQGWYIKTRSDRNISMKIMEYLSLRWIRNITGQVRLMADTLAAAISNSHVFWNMYEQFLEYNEEWSMTKMQEFLDMPLHTFWYLMDRKDVNMDNLNIGNKKIGSLLGTMASWLDVRTDNRSRYFDMNMNKFTKNIEWWQFNNDMVWEFLWTVWWQFQNFTNNQSLLMLLDLHAFVWTTARWVRPLSQVRNFAVTPAIKSLLETDIPILSDIRPNAKQTLQDFIKSEFDYIEKLVKRAKPVPWSFSAKEIEWYLFDMTSNINWFAQRVSWKRFETIAMVADIWNFKNARLLSWWLDKVIQKLDRYFEWVEQTDWGKVLALYNRLNGKVATEIRIGDPSKNGEFRFTIEEKELLWNDFLNFYNTQLPWDINDMKLTRMLLLWNRINELRQEWIEESRIESLLEKSERLKRDELNKASQENESLVRAYEWLVEESAQIDSFEQTQDKKANEDLNAIVRDLSVAELRLTNIRRDIQDTTEKMDRYAQEWFVTSELELEVSDLRELETNQMQVVSGLRDQYNDLVDVLEIQPSGDYEVWWWTLARQMTAEDRVRMLQDLEWSSINKKQRRALVGKDARERMQEAISKNELRAEAELKKRYQWDPQKLTQEIINDNVPQEIMDAFENGEYLNTLDDINLHC